MTRLGEGAAITFVRAHYLDPAAHGNWPFGTDHNGYGEVRDHYLRLRAHVISCKLAHGPKPTPQHQVAHSCGTPSCFYAGHLRWATPAENQADRVIDGTNLYGESHPMVKLTEKQVIEIRLRWLTGEDTQAELGREYGVTMQCVWQIVHGKSWKHVWKNFSVFDDEVA